MIGQPIRIEHQFENQYKDKKPETEQKKKSFQIKIDQVKIGLLQSSTNHEAAFSNYDYSRNIPCLTYLITWFDSIDFSGGVDQYDQIELNGQLRFGFETYPASTAWRILDPFRPRLYQGPF